MSVSLNSDEQEPLVVCVAPNGARRSQKDHEHIPLTADELAREALSCIEAGAQVMHLHVRNPQGAHSLDPTIYRAAIAAIRNSAGPGLIIQVTTEAGGLYAPAEQMAVILELKPQACSVALRELIPDTEAEGRAADFLQCVVRARTGVQFILYSPAEVIRLRQLLKRGVIPEARPHALFVLGNYRDQTPAAPGSLLPFLREWPASWPWTVCAFGKTEALCLAAALALGGHVRVGFENNLWNPDGSRAPSNASLIRNICAIADRTGRKRADFDQARKLYTPRFPATGTGTEIDGH